MFRAILSAYNIVIIIIILSSSYLLAGIIITNTLYHWSFTIGVYLNINHSSKMSPPIINSDAKTTNTVIINYAEYVTRKEGEVVL